ncbi:N-acetylmannosamine-6-phosphate 2-epimerase [Micrococcaceae bacterium Sec7.4]
MTRHAALIKSLMGGLIVSCQARAGNPLHGPVHMAAMALAAEQGGAAALRIQGEDDIRAVKERCSLPVIGIRKVFDAGPVYITPTFADAAIIVAAGADIVALDATSRPRSGPESAFELIRRIRGELGVPVMADVDSLAAGQAAAAAGAELIATTLSGYTSDDAVPTSPDFALLEHLWSAINVPIIAEGRFWEPGQVEDAFLLGASAVVIGTAVTNPMRITERFVRSTPAHAQG